MSEWRIRHSAATSTPSGRGFLVYIEVPSSSSSSSTSPNTATETPTTITNNNNINNNQLQPNRCTCLTEIGNTPIATVEHLNVASVVVCDFVSDDHHDRTVTTWMCVVHREEHMDSVGRTAIGNNGKKGGGASIITSYPIGASDGDASPRICPLYGISARAARQGVTGCYVFGTPPAVWKVPLVCRAQSVTGQWVGQPIIPMTGTSMTFDLMPESATSSTFAPPLGSSQHQQHSQQYLQINAWCLLNPYKVVPVFLCSGSGGGFSSSGVYHHHHSDHASSSSSSSLEGSVLNEFTLAGGVTIVVFMTLQNVIHLFAVECAAGGDALIWHSIPGECHRFVGDQTLLGSSSSASYGVMDSSMASSSSSLTLSSSNSSNYCCDEVQCEVIPSKDPMRCILALRFPRTQSVVVLETPPLRTESAFFPLDQPLANHHPQHGNTTTSSNHQHQHQNFEHNNTSAASSQQRRHHVDPTAAYQQYHQQQQQHHHSLPSSRSASQMTTASSSLISNAQTHPSCSPQRCEFHILERFTATTTTSSSSSSATTSGFSLFRWSPIGAGAALSAFSSSSSFFTPFFGIVDHGTRQVSILARGSTPGRVENIATLELQQQSSFSTNNNSNNNHPDNSHVTQPCPLLGSYLICRDRLTTSWHVNQRLPCLRPCSVEFFILTTLMSVLPQHSEDLYQFIVQTMLVNHKNNSGGDAFDFFETVRFFLLGTVNNKNDKNDNNSAEKQSNKKSSSSLSVFSPWNTNTMRMMNNKKNKSVSTSSEQQQRQPPKTIDSISLQVSTFSLHILCESLKVDRLYANSSTKVVEDLARLVLKLSESSDLPYYTRYYRDFLMEEDDFSENNQRENNNNINTVPSSSSSSAPKRGTNKNKTDEAAANKLNNSIDDQHQLLSMTLRQFFTGLSTSSTSTSFDPTIPLDIFSHLRWMSEGLLTNDSSSSLLSSWPTLKSFSLLGEDENNNASNSNNNDYDEECGSAAFARILRKHDPFRHASDVFNFSRSVFCGGNNNNNQPTSIIEKAVDLGWNSNFLETRLPAGIARPIYHAISLCCGDRLSVVADHLAWRPEALDLIGRHDIILAALNQNQQSQQSNNNIYYHNSSSGNNNNMNRQQLRHRQRVLLARAVPPERKVQREAILFSESLSRHVEACASGSSLAQIIETEAPVGPFSQVKTEKIHSLLSATSPIPLPSGIDPAEAAQSTLPLLVRRAVAVAVARGMLNLATHNFRERDRVPVPPLCLSGLTADGLVVNCDSRMVSPETMKWPTFHNACAAALRFLPLPPVSSKSNVPQTANHKSPIGRHWIVHQARDTQHRAGVLLAIGLLGHLSQLQLTDIYSIFVAPSAQDPQREPLTIAMLLGLGSSFRRTRSEAVFRCLAVHIQSLTPNGEDVEVSLDVQSAALIALGLVFEGAGQSFLVDMLLNDISRPPSDQVSRQREGYSLASGIALGLMLLGHGRNHNLSHLGIEERLLSFLEGGKRDHARPHLFRPDSVYSDVTESVVYPHSDEKFLTRALVSQARVDVVDPCNTVSEGKTFNTQITGPAATMALGLMFMKTRDEWIARHLDLPSTLPLLDAVTPQLSILRVLCASLIRWKSNEPPTDIVDSYLPDCLKRYMIQLKTNVSLRELDTQAQYRSLHVGYAHAGAALAVGMMFAGTLVASVKSLLLAAFEGFADGNIGSTGIPQPMIHKKSHSFDQCLASTAIAVALVSAGTGDADVLNVLTSVLKRGNFTYGTYMAISSAIGLLFLGGGRCTLSNSVQSVAALLLAFYPRWPQAAGDNTNHLQALRHFYTLSVVPRWLSTFDVDSGRVVTSSARLVMNTASQEAGLEVSLARPDRDVSELAKMWTPIPSQKQQQQQRPNQQQQQQQSSSALPIVTPCLLPEITNIERVEIREPGFYNLTIWNGNGNGNNNNNQSMFNNNRSAAIGVKKKPQLFFGDIPRVFGPQNNHPWDAAIRDSLVMYNHRNKFSSSSSSVSCIQDLSLMLSPSAALSMMNVNLINLTNSPSSSSLPSTIHLVEKLSDAFNRIFITKDFLMRAVASDDRNNSSSFLSSEERKWKNHALHYCGLNVWWKEREAILTNLVNMVNTTNRNEDAAAASATTVVDKNAVLDCAVRGRFGVELVMGLLTTM